MSTHTDKHEYWIIFHNDQLLTLKDHPDSKLLTAFTIQDLQADFLRHYHLGQIESQDVYCAELPLTFEIPSHLEALSLRKALEMLGSDWYNIAAKAYAVIHWDKNHHYCGRCGQPTEHKPGTFERSCATCHLFFYPRISPSIIVMIHKDNHILMARSPHFPPGAYGLIAGFVEAGESLEEAVHREVKEETNLIIKNLQFFGSQSWPFPDSLMVAFTADYASGELIIDKTELETAGWYRYDQLPGRPSNRISISSKLIDHFIAQQTQSSIK